MSHDPDEEEARRDRASRGGRTAGRGRPLTEVGQVKKRLSKLADDVLSGAVERPTGAVVSQIYNVLLRGIDLEIKARELDEIETRLADIEDALSNGPGDRGGGWYRPGS
jgi:hypothetical protein